MPRTNIVKSAKKARRCSACGGTIEPGQPYQWFAIKLQRGGIRKNFHTTCRIRPSMKTNSPTRQTILQAQEAAEDAFADTAGMALSDIAQVVRDYGEAIREVSDMKRESAQNIEEGFGHPTYQSEELEQAAEECEQFADNCDQMADEIESMDDPDADAEEFKSDFPGEVDGDGEPLDQDEFESHVEEQREERRAAAVEAAMEVTNDEPEI